MEHELVVTRPFGNYARGDVITTPAAMDVVLASENANHVVRREVQTLDIPAPPAKEG